MASEWISVEDQLPESEADVLAFSPESRIQIGWHKMAPQGGWRPLGQHDKVTHWMPLPEPPEPRL